MTATMEVSVSIGDQTQRFTGQVEIRTKEHLCGKWGWFLVVLDCDDFGEYHGSYDTEYDAIQAAKLWIVRNGGSLAARAQEKEEKE